MRATLSLLMLIGVAFAGCAEQEPAPAVTTDPPAAPEPLATFRVIDVGEPGPEPSIGVTSSGCIFFAALEKVMKSCDKGVTWSETQDVFSQPATSDPYLWVDAVTDRVFNIQMVSLACTWIAWTDNDGADWLGNPLDCGTTPVNDHIKLATGPWVGAGSGLGSNPAYPQAVYFCYNKLVAVQCCTSTDGGATFAVCRPAGPGGLHGAIATAPDGTVFVPPRAETPTVFMSPDNGVTWTTATMGADVGTANPRKNSEVAADNASNAYHTWIGGDMGVYLSRSIDGGAKWDETSVRVSPVGVVSATFPHIQAGDPGRVAVAYLGSEDASKIDTPDIDENDWDGNPHTAPEGVHYHLYVSYSLNALDQNATWKTVRVTSDPVQVGSICVSSGDCRGAGAKSNRNLLDFNDMSLDRQGRIYIAFADGCTKECATAADPKAEDSRSRAGAVAILETGPSLYAGIGEFNGL